jgi:hypothetical protein
MEASPYYFPVTYRQPYQTHSQRNTRGKVPHRTCQDVLCQLMNLFNTFHPGTGQPNILRLSRTISRNGKLVGIDN